MTKKIRSKLSGKNARLSKPERTKLLRELKEKALNGNIAAANALGTLELAETAKKSFEANLDCKFGFTNNG